MKRLLKYILIVLFCISAINSACDSTVKTTCEGDSSCKWTVGVAAHCGGTDNGAQTPISCDTFDSSDTCTGGTCSWVAETGTCSDKTCTDYNSAETCNAASGCEWNTNTCSTESATPTCADYETEEACNAASGCEWNTDTCSTESESTPTCTDYETEEACNAVTTCQWSNNACSTKSTPTTTTNGGVFGLNSSILIFLISFLF